MSSDAPHSGTAEQIMQRIDTTRPHTARIWNYWTGGKDNYPVDREAGTRSASCTPASVTTRVPTGSSSAVRCAT